MTITAHRNPTQRERVLAALRTNPAGVNETAWAAPWVIDHGKPIQRVAARIFELRQDGYEIRTRRLSNGTATYILESEPTSVFAVDADTGQTFLVADEAA